MAESSISGGKETALMRNVQCASLFMTLLQRQMRDRCHARRGKTASVALVKLFHQGHKHVGMNFMVCPTDNLRLSEK